MNAKPLAAPGDYVILWHNTGCFGVSPIYGRVISVGKQFYFALFEYADRCARRIEHHRVDLTGPGTGHLVATAQEYWLKNVKPSLRDKYFPKEKL